MKKHICSYERYRIQISLAQELSAADALDINHEFIAASIATRNQAGVGIGVCAAKSRLESAFIGTTHKSGFD